MKTCGDFIEERTAGERLQQRLETFNVRDFLMSISWLKLYETEEIMAGTWSLAEKTIRIKVKAYTCWIQAMKERKIHFQEENDDTFIISLDGVHCTIYEPRRDPSSKWYSHKSNSAGLTYEIGIAIRSNNVVWVNGPFPASQHDITTFRGGKKGQPQDPEALQFKIPDGKRAIGDSGYRGEPAKISITRKDDSAQVKKFKGRVKARHETFNSRLKQFGVLKGKFRHKLSDSLDEHRRAFEAVCVLCQYSLENGNGLFEV
eukprot:scaffold2088_cov119-Cylindrotheca_fusiformis.AAC.2